MKNTISTTIEPKAKAFRLGYSVLIIVFVLQIILVVFSLCLQARTVVKYELVEVEKEVIVEVPQQVKVPQVRTVDQMIQEDDSMPNVDDEDVLPPFLADVTNDEISVHKVVEPDAQSIKPKRSEAGKLVLDARYARIEGDLKLCVLKLEQALLLEPENPEALYEYGLAYEKLRNAEKSREFFLRVYSMRENAGTLFDKAVIHLRNGFSKPSDMLSSIVLGTIREKREILDDGEKITLTIPVFAKEEVGLREKDLHIVSRFFDLVNSKELREVNNNRKKDRVSSNWISSDLDWKDGEELLEVTYFLKKQTEDEMLVYGAEAYHGYVIELYYKGEPMDCATTIPVWFLIDRMNKSKALDDFLFEGESGLLPPVEIAEPVSDESLPF